MKDPVVVDSFCQTFGGYRYRKAKGNYYRRSVPTSTGYRVEYLHRAVWIAANGPMAKGMQVHHKNENPDDNSLGNLESVTAKQHAACHLTPERSAAMAAHMVAVAVPAARAWHATPEGRAWHKEHARKVWVGRTPTQMVCAQCGSTYETLRAAHSKFCHLNCKMAALRARRRTAPPRAVAARPTVTKTCPVCADTFTATACRPAVACSDRCRRALRLRESGASLPATFGI